MKRSLEVKEQMKVGVLKVKNPMVIVQMHVPSLANTCVDRRPNGKLRSSCKSRSDFTLLNHFCLGPKKAFRPLSESHRYHSLVHEVYHSPS